VAQPTTDRIAAFVHTHGARLVRLAHLLGAREPEQAGADAVAATLQRRGSGDAHDDLVSAARHVGAMGDPPVRDDGRLQEWLDRAALSEHPVDLAALQHATVERLAVQRADRSRQRRRTAAGALGVVALVVAASALTDADDVAPAPSQATERLEGYPPDPVAEGPVDLSGLQPPAPRRLPEDQRSSAGMIVENTFMAGPATPVARVHMNGEPTTVVAIGCAPFQGPPSVCAISVPRGAPLRQSTPIALLALLPVPVGDQLISDWDPAVSRESLVDEFDQRTVLWEVASAEIGTLHVDFSDGRSATATRYRHPSWDQALFLLVAGDQMPARLSYMADGIALDRRFLYTATP